MIKRKLKQQEIDLISYMIEITEEGKRIVSKLPEIFVEEMNDGGMGSLRVVVDGEDNRRTGGVLVDKDFYDEDGMLLIVSIILDADKNFYELDIFKGDFSPLRRFPSVP
ncbi:hypothetical protein DHW03_05595 [Pedobacter yonginense]|uniref:DUF6984 domain-containing protein n=1 Tax=Pedobacter yonginense TaxID=651869 RepID=A0A317EQX3_9SPHI|nr:hypothetical protein [Pedobacter yonginense]PWS29291.1 hypothetical protein DHW03_05595 [Pedobacter yonginense]